MIRQVFSTVTLAACIAGCSGAATSTGTASPSIGGISLWRAPDASADPITGKTTAVATLVADGASSLGQQIVLYVRCKDDATDVYIAWSDYLGNGDTVSVTTRLDDDPPTTDQWDLSTDNTSTFYSSSSQRSINYIHSLFTHKLLAARVTPYSSSPVTAVFQLTGIDAAVAGVRSACQW